MATSPADRTIEEIVRDASSAPSMHNAQPWRFRYDRADRVFELRPDLERSMAHADRFHRALHLGCGAALFNLRVAAAHRGWYPGTSILPRPEDQRLLARVRLEERQPPQDLVGLYPALSRRHTSRDPFEPRPVPESVREELCRAAEAEGAGMSFPERWYVESIADLVQDAEAHDVLAPDPDLVRWTYPGAHAEDEGVPEHAFGPRKRRGRAPVRDFAGRRRVPGRATADFEADPQLALLSTRRDRIPDWVRAGQALERVLLLATLRGLATALTSHALEAPELRWLVRDPQAPPGHVQMVLRLGYGPPGPPTPRRSVRDVLVITGAAG
jgi:nitroreductase